MTFKSGTEGSKWTRDNRPNEMNRLILISWLDDPDTFARMPVGLQLVGQTLEEEAARRRAHRHARQCSWRRYGPRGVRPPTHCRRPSPPLTCIPQLDHRPRVLQRHLRAQSLLRPPPLLRRANLPSRPGRLALRARADVEQPQRTQSVRAGRPRGPALAKGPARRQEAVERGGVCVGGSRRRRARGVLVLCGDVGGRRGRASPAREARAGDGEEGAARCRACR